MGGQRRKKERLFKGAAQIMNCLHLCAHTSRPAAAALWTLDGAFEVAAAGAVGVNLHQGAGQNLYTGEQCGGVYMAQLDSESCLA